MLRIYCTHCGERDEIEFTYMGETGRVRPRPDDVSGWPAYLYWRTTARGRTRELWLHAGGCRRWLLVERDTVEGVLLTVQDASAPGGMR